jgi:hypothetical protein
VLVFTPNAVKGQKWRVRVTLARRSQFCFAAKTEAFIRAGVHSLSNPCQLAHRSGFVAMCTVAKYTQKFKNCDKKDNPHCETMTTVIKECDNPQKGIFCPNAVEDKSTIFGSVSKPGPCPLCPAKKVRLSVRCFPSANG